MNGNSVIYFDSFGVENIPQTNKKIIANKNIIKKIYLIQAHDSIMCGYFCIKFTDFMLKDKIFLDYTIFFLTNMKRMIK